MIYVIGLIAGILFILYLASCFHDGYNEALSKSYFAEKEKERRRKNKK